MAMLTILFFICCSGLVAQEYKAYWEMPAYSISAEDSIFLDQLQQDTFNWFWEKAHSSTGLNPDRAADNSTSNAHISIASVGFGLTACGVGAERGFVSRIQAAERVDKVLRTLLRGTMGSESTGHVGYRGWYYHWLDANSLSRTWNSELSSIDTALLMLGVIFVRNYFDDPNDALETAIRDSASVMLERVDWRFMRNPNTRGISGGWFPEDGFINWEYRGYNEAMLLYILAIGGDLNPLSESSWGFWKGGYRYESTDYFVHPFITFSPLFGHHYPHAWIDFREIYNKELELLGEKYDYFENARRATYASRAYAIANPKNWPNYGPDEWGLTACDGPRNFGFNGYMARGASGQNIVDDGTIAPTAAGGSIAYAPEIVIPMLRQLKDKYGSKLYGNYGFRDAFNDSVNWFDNDYIGIDQGPILLMIENLRSGMVWEVMKRDPIIVRGLQRAGFSGGWLETTSVQEEAELPADFGLQNYPNPFKTGTTIQFHLKKAQAARLEIFNVRGQKISTAIDKNLSAGQYKITWRPDALPTGMYWARLVAGKSAKTLKLLYLR